LPIPSLVICTQIRVWRYQRGNQNPYIEEEHATKWPNEKVQKDKQRSTKHTYKIKDRVTQVTEYFSTRWWYLPNFCWKVDFLTTQQLTLEKCGKGRIEYTGDMQRCLNYAIINTISATIRIRHYVMKITRKANNYHTVGKKRFKQWWSTIHQYQQNEQSQLTSTHWTEKKTQHMLKIHVLHLDRHNNVMGFNRLKGSQHSPFDLLCLIHIFV
jgi:hypothetical protein